MNNESNMMYCPNCGAQISKQAYACTQCGTLIAKSNPKKANNMNAYKIIAIVLMALSIIGGIYLGNQYGIERCADYSYSYTYGYTCEEYEEVFNFGLMFSSWISSFIIYTIIYGIGDIISILKQRDRK